MSAPVRCCLSWTEIVSLLRGVGVGVAKENVSGVVLNTELRGTLAENIAVLRARLRVSLCVRWKERERGVGGGEMLSFHV